jgi:hypothetical protein
MPGKTASKTATKSRKPKATTSRVKPHAAHPIDKQLIKEMKSLSKEVRNLKNLEFVRILKHPWKFLWLSLLKGMMIGLGTVLGASVLVGVVIYILGQISLVPIVGDFVEEVLGQIQLGQVQLDQKSSNP